MVLPRFIGITDLRNNVRRVFDRLSKDREPIVVIRESKPEAVIVPYAEYEQLLHGHQAENKTPAAPSALPHMP